MTEFTEEQVRQIAKAAELITTALSEGMRATDEIDDTAAIGTNDLIFETVKPGYVLILEQLSGYNNVSACTRIRVGYWNGHRLNWLETQPAPLVTETVVLKGPLHLRDGMYPIVRFEGCALNDDIFACLNGYWVKT